MRIKRWTWAEEQILRDRHGDTSVADLAVRLGRSEKAVRGHMERMGISLREAGTHVRGGKFTVSTWTDDDNLLLTEHLYAPMREIVALFPGRSYASVFNQAQTLGRPKRYKGWTMQHGRKMIRVGNGYVAEHRLIAAESLGRELEPEECVHHINCDKTDNAPGNLHVYESPSAHMWGHRTLDAAVKELMGRGTIRFNRGRYEVC